MPNTKSAKKMLRRDIKARARNRSQHKTMKTMLKKFHSSLSGDMSHIETAFRRAQSYAQSAGRKNLIPKGRASRIISRMNLKRIEALRVV